MVEMQTASEKETKLLGAKFGKLLRAGDIVLLSGDLGAGKTVLTRGIVSALGGDEADVHSPSYTYVNHYSANIPIYHLDVYLLEHYDDVLELGIEDFWKTPSVMLIEWGDRFQHDFQRPYWVIAMQYTENEQTRIINIRAPEREPEREKELAVLL